MKRITAIILSVVIAVLLGITAAAEGDFVITDGVLTAYTGTGTDITIPEEVTHIEAGAFDTCPELTRITITSMTCTVAPGAVPRDVTIRAYDGSEAQGVALYRDNLNFELIEAPDTAPQTVDTTPVTEPETYSVTVYFLYADGTPAADTYFAEFGDGENFTVTPPTIDGFKPDKAVISGTISGMSITETVKYTSTTDSGWKLSGRNLMYYDTTGYVTSATKTVDGKTYSFDAYGNLILSNEFINVGGETYYLVNNMITTGYVKAGDGIYCFDASGAMLKNTSRDGYEFDINGRLIGDNLLLNFDGEKYYIVDNRLYSGYTLIGDGIYLFDEDCAMVTDTSVDGYVFGSDGRLVSGIDILHLQITPPTNIASTGEPLTPPVYVTFEGVVLVENVHYTLSYENNIEPGNATVTVTGIGPVTGTASVMFKVLNEEARTLTVKYVNSLGVSLYPPYTTQVEPGEKYSVDSPTVDGYKPDKKVVSGTMPENDLTVTVTYSKSTGNEDGTAKVETKIVKTPGEKKVTYNYGLLIKVFVISTVIVGTAILLIINGDMIKANFAKKKAARGTKKH